MKTENLVFTIFGECLGLFVLDYLLNRLGWSRFPVNRLTLRLPLALSSIQQLSLLSSRFFQKISA